MKPEQSKKFLNILLLVSLTWLLMGTGIYWNQPEGRSAFYQVFLLTLLDLLFLVFLFWRLFFTPPEQRGRNLQVVIFLTFKLVCLGFLAITLKRLRNAPDAAALLGIGFMAVGPIVSAVISRRYNETQQG